MLLYSNSFMFDSAERVSYQVPGDVDFIWAGIYWQCYTTVSWLGSAGGWWSPQTQEQPIQSKLRYLIPSTLQPLDTDSPNHS